MDRTGLNKWLLASILSFADERGERQTSGRTIGLSEWLRHPPPPANKSHVNIIPSMDSGDRQTVRTRIETDGYFQTRAMHAIPGHLLLPPPLLPFSAEAAVTRRPAASFLLGRTLTVLIGGDRWRCEINTTNDCFYFNSKQKRKEREVN